MACLPQCVLDLLRLLALSPPPGTKVCCRRELREVEARKAREGHDTVATYSTPVGTVTTRARQSAALAAAGVYGDVTIQRMIKTEADYAVAAFISIGRGNTVLATECGLPSWRGPTT
jgi:hypothetical protein